MFDEEMLLEQIRETIKNEINPILDLHSGYCEAVSVELGLLTLKMQGGCAGCPSAKMTLFNGIAPIIKKNHPIIEDFKLV